MQRLKSFTVLAVAVLGGCGGEEKRGVPAGIRPEDAVFHYEHSSGTSQDRLVVRLSLANVCNAEEVPQGAELVEIRVDAPLGMPAVPDTYVVDGDGCAVVLVESDARCTGSVGQGSNRGSVTLESVTSEEVRGTFHGLNEDGNLDLKGAFVARQCLDTQARCL
jgi:hypothetical protein